MLVGPNSHLEACDISNNTFIGMGTSVRNGAKINSNSVIAAGAVIPEGVEVKSN